MIILCGLITRKRHFSILSIVSRKILIRAALTFLKWKMLEDLHTHHSVRLFIKIINKVINSFVHCFTFIQWQNCNTIYHCFCFQRLLFIQFSAHQIVSIWPVVGMLCNVFTESSLRMTVTLINAWFLISARSTCFLDGINR